MKVLLVTAFYAPAWSGGGIARATQGLAEGLATLGHAVTVLTIRWSAEDPLEEQRGGVRVRRLESPRWLRERLFPWPAGVGSAIREASDGGFDAAHFAGYRTGLAWAAWRFLRRSGVPYVVQPHGTLPHHGAWRMAKVVVDRLFGSDLIRGAAELVAVSDAEAADLPGHAVVIPNGVAAVGTARRSVGAHEKELLFVGSDAPQKRGLWLAAILRALPEARLTFVGRCGTRFRERFADFAGRVAFRGVLAGDALASAYADASVLAQPAVGEAFGLAPFEAALCGTPAVVAGGHGAGEWFGRAGGCVLPAGEAAAWTSALRARLESPSLAAREAQAVAAFARQELTWPVVARQVQAVYEQAVRRSDTGR